MKVGSKIRLFKESKITEAYPQEFNQAVNASRAKKMIGSYLSTHLGISAQNLDIGSLMTPLKSARDPKIKNSVIVMMINAFPEVKGKYGFDIDYNADKVPTLVAFDGNYTIVNATISRYQKGYSRYSGAPEYIYKRASSYSWTELIEMSKATWVIDYSNLEKDVDGLHQSRVDARDGSVIRNPEYAGKYGYDASGYAIDSSKYKRMLKDIKGKQGADKIRAEFDSLVDEYESLVDKIIPNLSNRYKLKNSDSSSFDTSKVLSDLESIKNVLERNMERVSKLVSDDNWEVSYIKSSMDRVRQYIDEFKSKYDGKLESMTESMDSESNLSPDMFDVYDNKGAVPQALQLVRKAIAQETQAISEYELMKNSGNFDGTQKAIIDEIINDEKDHIVNFTRLLGELTNKNYSGYGDNPESEDDSKDDSKNESKLKSNKIKLF